MKFTVEQFKKAKLAKNVEELMVLAKESGMELTEEKASKLYAELHKEGTLADEELDNVSGGSCADDLDNQWNKLWGDYTDIYCKSCSWTTTWDGKYSKSTSYRGPCPVCQAPFIFAGEYHE